MPLLTPEEELELEAQLEAQSVEPGNCPQDLAGLIVQLDKLAQCGALTAILAQVGLPLVPTLRTNHRRGRAGIRHPGDGRGAGGRGAG